MNSAASLEAGIDSVCTARHLAFCNYDETRKIEVFLSGERFSCNTNANNDVDAFTTYLATRAKGSLDSIVFSGANKMLTQLTRSLTLQYPNCLRRRNCSRSGYRCESIKSFIGWRKENESTYPSTRAPQSVELMYFIAWFSICGRCKPLYGICLTYS